MREIHQIARPLQDLHGLNHMDAGRMEAFSDGVIAIIVTIMVLDLRPPSTVAPSALWSLWPTFLAYTLSFTLVAIYWVNHHHMLHIARRVGTDTLWLNINLLFWLSLFPFATAYLGSTRGAPFAVAVYAALSVIVAFAYLLLFKNLTHRNFDVPAVAGLARKSQRKNILALLAMLAAIPAAYSWEPLALLLLAAPAAAYVIPERHRPAKAESAAHLDSGTS